MEETLNIVSHGQPAAGLPASGLIVLGLGKLAAEMAELREVARNLWAERGDG